MWLVQWWSAPIRLVAPPVHPAPTQVDSYWQTHIISQQHIILYTSAPVAKATERNPEKVSLMDVFTKVDVVQPKDFPLHLIPFSPLRLPALPHTHIGTPGSILALHLFLKFVELLVLLLWSIRMSALRSCLVIHLSRKIKNRPRRRQVIQGRGKLPTPTF